MCGWGGATTDSSVLALAVAVAVAVVGMGVAGSAVVAVVLVVPVAATDVENARKDATLGLCAWEFGLRKYRRKQSFSRNRFRLASRGLRWPPAVDRSNSHCLPR